MSFLLTAASNNSKEDLQFLAEAEAAIAEARKQQHLELWEIMDEKTSAEIAKLRKQQHLKFWEILDGRTASPTITNDVHTESMRRQNWGMLRLRE
ncbi:hypothetical protein VNO80_05626 [Phaseolus coccineus]|uniref:Uncharacterized protein n=1 Tax=Phaseolus coccineus TaxID=3886 RepID=A0AAN9NGK8_PHACN